MCSRLLPTIQIFDAVWTVAFEWLNNVNKAAANYLQKTYFIKLPSVENINRQIYCGEPAGDKGSVYFAGFWTGVLGIHAASGSGSQTIESFHSHWQATLKADIKAAPTQIFATMQKIFRNDFEERYAWGSACDYFTSRSEESEALYNSQALRSAGRSPAVDFWQNRELRLCGGHNYRKIHRRTHGEETDGWNGMTTFHILRTQKLKEIAAAEAVIDKEVANNIVKLLTSQGPKLQKAIYETGIATKQQDKPHPLLDMSSLEKYFKFHCVVIDGHLAETLWANVHKKLTPSRGPTTLCSCHAFSLHGNCEHVIYVKALNKVDDYATKLSEVPIVRPKGRKRKTAATPNEKAPPAKQRRKTKKTAKAAKG